MTQTTIALQIRPATANDEATIKAMIRQERLDPTSLKWENFFVAEQDSKIVAIGQIKQYPGCQELGSLVTLPAYRGQGIAGQLIAALEEKAEWPLYLLCLAKMEPFYQRFGYEAISWWQAPAMLKLKLTPTLLVAPFGIRVRVMRKAAP